MRALDLTLRTKVFNNINSKRKDGGKKSLGEILIGVNNDKVAVIENVYIKKCEEGGIYRNVAIDVDYCGVLATER